MDVFEALRKRRTCRSFRTDTVPHELIKKLICAGQRAPTGGNVNTRRFIVIDDKKKLGLIQKLSPGYVGPSPLAIAICTDLMVEQSDYISIFDAGAAAENIALAATALGLGVGFVKSFPETVIRNLFGIPDAVRLDILVTVGYWAEVSRTQQIARSPAQPIFHNSYGNPWEAR